MNPHASLQSVVEMTRSIPCAPAILPKLLSITQNSSTDNSDIEKLILTDPGLATAVLRLANSAYFTRSRKCENISEAILRLGSLTLYRLAATTVAGRFLANPIHGYGWEPGDLCRHSLCVAISAELLAERSGIAAAELAYTAGLIHDVGKMALAYANLHALEEVAAMVPERQVTWRQAEREILGYDSTDVTRALLLNWGFPPVLVCVGLFHPCPSSAPEEHRGLTSLIHAAKHIAIQLGFGVGIDGFHFDLDEPALVAAGFEDAALEAAIPEIIERVERFIEPDGHLRTAN